MNSKTIIKNLIAKFAELYGASPSLYRAPGRVNLIGEHTDYNDGFVMPTAIDLRTYVAASFQPDRTIKVYSENFNESCEFSLNTLRPGKTSHWSDYVRGVAGVLESHGHKLKGANLALHGEVPVGSGLSSSAAIEVATAFALLDISGIHLSRTEIAKICQQAEHQYAGTPCGIMDQFISCHGKEGHALMLDCRSLEFQLLPLPAGTQLMICNTMVKHELATGEYAQRRSQCEEGVHKLLAVLSGIRALRDVTPAQLEQHRNLLTETVYRRCRHVVTENERVLNAAEALRGGNVAAFGQLMAASHRSLRDDYEVSCSELDLMVALASQQKGVYGARMTGGGFGGCTINLVDAQHTETARQEIARAYFEKTGLTPEIYICSASEGAEAVSLA